MASAGSIFVDLLLKDAQFVDGIKRSGNVTKKFADDANKAGKSFNSIVPSVNNVNASILRLGGVLASAFSVQKIIAYSDTYKNLQSRLSLVTNSSEELKNVTQDLFDIAQQNSQPVEATIDAYTRLNQSLNANQRASTDLIKFTDLLSKTLLVSGTNAAGAATFFQQFGQAASSDFKAVGQELQTFADQNPRFYSILRDEATKYGKTLKQMAADGELSFDFIAKATMNAADDIEADARRIELTVGKAFTNLNNSVLSFIGNSTLVDTSSDTLARALLGLSDKIDELNEDGISLESTFTGIAISFLEFARNIEEYKLRAAENFNFLGLTQSAVDQQKKYIDELNDKIENAGLSLLERNREKPEWIKRYEEEQKLLNEFFANKGGGEDPKKSAEDLKQIYERNLSLITGIDDATLKYMETERELARLLQNKTISTDQYQEALRRLDEKYDETAEKTNKWGLDMEAAGKRAAENIQDKFAQFLFDPFQGGLKGMLKGFIDTIREMAAQAAAARILEGLFPSKSNKGSAKSSGGGGSGLGDFLGGIFDGFFAEGGYIQPGHFGVAGEAGAELIYGGNTGATVIPQSSMGGGGNTYYIDSRGADMGAVRRIEQSLMALAGPGVVEQRVSNAQTRGAL